MSEEPTSRHLCKNCRFVLDDPRLPLRCGRLPEGAPLCYYERDDPSRCGPSAIHFQPKQTEIPFGQDYILGPV